MEIITSTSNPLVKETRKLKEAVARTQTGLYLVEGANIVKDLPSTAIVETLFVEQNKADEFAPIVARVRARRIVLASAVVMKAIGDTVTPSGLTAVLRIPERAALSGETVVVCDGISDPGNLGTIMRTCVACGVKDLILIGGADPYAPKTVRASMGAVLRLNLCRTDRCGAVDSLKGFRIFSLDMGGENLFEFHRGTDRFALCVGGEAHGLSPEMRAASDRILSLPMIGDVESLNAGVSLSVALYALTFR